MGVGKILTIERIASVPRYKKENKNEAEEFVKKFVMARFCMRSRECLELGLEKQATERITYAASLVLRWASPLMSRHLAHSKLSNPATGPKDRHPPQSLFTSLDCSDLLVPNSVSGLLCLSPKTVIQLQMAKLTHNKTIIIFKRVHITKRSMHSYGWIWYSNKIISNLFPFSCFCFSLCWLHSFFF